MKYEMGNSIQVLNGIFQITETNPVGGLYITFIRNVQTFKKRRVKSNGTIFIYCEKQRSPKSVFT